MVLSRPTRFLALLASLVLTVGNTAGWAHQDADQLSQRFRQAARRVLPAVVTVRAVSAPEIGVGAPPGLLPGGIQPHDLGGSGVVIDAKKASC
jgi:hypothetical protein